MENELLKEILEGDYHLVLISGEFHDCPTCNDSATLVPQAFWDEKSLLTHMLQHASSDRMEAIWIADSWGTGHMYKYCDIKMKASMHQVQQLEFDLPSGHVMMVNNGGGSFRLLTPAEQVLYGHGKDSKV